MRADRRLAEEFGTPGDLSAECQLPPNIAEPGGLPVRTPSHSAEAGGNKCQVG